ncbi:hypothetical protein ACHWQZ_G015116 [Mnemiopsis leidyi]
MALADKGAFNRRIERLYSYWKENLSHVDSLSIAVTNDDDVTYSKGISLMIWLLGYELRDTIMFFTMEDIFVISSKKKTDFLRPLRDVLSKKDDLPNMTLLTRMKGDSGADHMKTVIEKAKTLKSVGYFPKDNFKGELAKQWNSKLKELEIDQVDATTHIALCLAVKDEQELTHLKKVSQYTSDIFSKYVRNELMNLVDEEKKVKHARMSANIENLVAEGKKCLLPGMEKDSVEVAYTPIIQSKKFSLKFSASSDEERIDYSNKSSVTVLFGTRYKSYCSNISRTVLVEPAEKQQQNYETLLEIVEKVYTIMTENTKLSTVYNKCVEFVKEKRPDWLTNFPKNIGFGTGIEFREPSLLIGPKNDNVLKKNMVFILQIGVVGLKEDDKDYALMLGDTVVIGDSGATVLTPSKKKIRSVSIFLKGEGDEEEEEEQEDLFENVTRQSKRTAVLDNKLRHEPLSDDKRKEHQRKLVDKLNQEARERLSAKKNGYKSVKKIQTSVAFKNLQSFPSNDPDIRDLKIMVDKKHESVIIPIFGIPTPFHISTIKNVSKSEEGDYVYLRTNLNVPGTQVAKDEHYANPEATFMKEITFRSNMRKTGSGEVPAMHLNNAFRIIKEVQKKFKQFENEKKEMEDVIEQETLKITQTKGVPRLKDLYCRPNLSTRRVIGTLEAHSNGFRFHNTHGGNVDVIYSTIKHAFFQPCDKEMLIMLHFYLKHPIMIGKKKTYHICFYTEVGEIMTDLGKSSHMYDRDDIEAEHAEREMRQKLKGAFKNFIEKVEALSKGRVEFDTPFRELGFFGVPFRSSCMLQPTTHCLINVIEWPPFVIALEEVELVHFERVQFQLKNFDMVFIFKDYSRKIEMINSIPMSSLDAIKEWLNSCDLKYTEGAISLNWPKIMKTINDNPENFFEDGGWKFLDPESEEEGEDEDSDAAGDESWGPGELNSEEDGSEESDSDEEYKSEDSSGNIASDDSYSGTGSSEESGKDWSDLEEEARRDDQRRLREEREDDSPKKKRKIAPPPKSKSSKKKRG